MVTASRFKRLRLILGESQWTFAERFGVDQSSISRWEDGELPESGPTRLLIERVVAEIEESLPAVLR